MSRLSAVPLSRQRRVLPADRGPDGGRKHRPDYVLLVLMGILLACGLVVLYSIGPGLTSGTDLNDNYYSTKQLTAIFLGLVCFVGASFMTARSLKQVTSYVILAAAASAVVVRFAGEAVNGAHRWIQIGGFSFQPAELIKLALVLWLAKFLSEKRAADKMRSPETLKQLGMLLGLVVVVVAGLQSDLGSASVMMAVIGSMAFFAGLPLEKIAIVGVGLLIVASLAILSTPYRRDRVATFFNPTADCQNEGYQACQALITIGSGGLFGKGLGRSVQAYGYLPEPANDSIFAIVAEKFGFVGCIVILGVFFALFSRIANIARAAPNDYMMLLSSGVFVWLSVQMMINVGAMIGLLPLKGITLPFVSYGGTSIIFVMIAMGLVFKISKYTDLSKASFSNNGQRSRLSSNTRRTVYGRH